MTKTRRKFDQDFRDGAVRLVCETGKPIAQVARGSGHSRDAGQPGGRGPAATAGR